MPQIHYYWKQDVPFCVGSNKVLYNHLKTNETKNSWIKKECIVNFKRMLMIRRTCNNDGYG